VSLQLPGGLRQPRRIDAPAMNTWLGIFQDEQPMTSLAGVQRGTRSLWVDGHARDFAALREFRSLETLSIYRLPRRHVPVLPNCDLPQLTSLCVRHGDTEDLTFLAGFGTLDALTIWQSPKLRRLDGLEALTRLTTLVLSDLGTIESLAPLSALSGLRTLALTGGVWKTQGLPSLAPHSANTGLEQLSLAGAKVADGDLGPICDLTRLQRLDLSSRNFEPEEIARVAAAHDFWRRELLELGDFDQWAGSPGCRVCGTHRKIFFLRRKKLLWCPRCEGDKLAALIDDFQRLVEEKRRERQLGTR